MCTRSRFLFSKWKFDFFVRHGKFHSSTLIEFEVLLIFSGFSADNLRKKVFLPLPSWNFEFFFRFVGFKGEKCRLTWKSRERENIPILIFHISLMLYYFRGWFLFIFDSFSITLFYCVEFIMRMFFLFLMKSINWSKMYLTTGRLWVQRKTRLK